MDLNQILEKTKKRSEQIKIIRKPPSIATEDRPYGAEEEEEIAKITLSETDNKLITNQQQTNNKPTTNRQQTDNKNKNDFSFKQQTDNKLVAQPTTQLVTNKQQTDNKLITKTSFSSLVGLQRTIMTFFYQDCKISRSKITNSLTLEHIATCVKTTTGAVKTSTQRLEAKKCIIRREFKNGRGGWSKYELPEELFREMFQYETDNKLATNWQQIDNKLVAQPTTELATTLSSSSSSNLINNKTTTTGGDDFLNSDAFTSWREIDITALAEFGFSQTHLIQLAQQGKLSTEVVQNSIHAFAFDLKNNNKAKTLKTDAVNFFMGILRNGQPYAPPSNYESPQEESLRIYVERQQELERKRTELEKAAFDFACKEWLVTLTEEEKNNLLPLAARGYKAEQPRLACLKEHFKNTIWPIKRNEILQPKDGVLLKNGMNE